jgi:glycosyltransferase involved in cell wall biosynthesis
MIRLVFLIRSLHRGGAERQLATLVERMDKHRWDVTVITFYSGGQFEAELIGQGVRLISLRKRGRWDVIRFLGRLVRELRRIRPDIIHSYLVEPNLAAVFVKPFFSSTKIVWGVRAANMDLAHYDWFARMNFRLETLASRLADKIILNSNAGRDYHVAQGMPARKCMVVHSGIDTERFKPDRESGKAIRREWGISDEKILIGLVGRLDPIKDHPTFLKAAALISLEDSDLRFVCVGSGAQPYARDLRRMADECKISDRLIWASEREDMPAVYNALDIACSSSSGEGLPNAIAEAMACQVPCVATDVGDSSSLVGNSGILVPANSPQALATGLSKSVNLLRARQAPNPRPRIIEKFSLTRLVNQTEAALMALVEH